MNEQKNLLLAIVASLLILLVFQYFFPTKSDIKTVDNNNINNSIENNIDSVQGKILPREEIVASDNRIFISKESALSDGSSLQGHQSLAP